MAERRMRKREGQQEVFFDYTLLFIVLFLLAFGLVMLYSTSSYDAYIDFRISESRTASLSRRSASIPFLNG